MHTSSLRSSGFKLLFSVLGFLFSCAFALAAPIKFNIPAQPAADALTAFSKQSGMDVLYASRDLKKVQSQAVVGEFEPDAAIALLLKDTGFTATRDGSKFLIKAANADAGSIRGSLVGEGGQALAGVLVAIQQTGQSAETDKYGQYVFPKMAAGTYVLVATGAGYQPLHITDVSVRAGRELTLSKEEMRKAREGPLALEPFVVHAELVTELDKYEVTGRKVAPFSDRNADIPRTINDVQPYYVFDSNQIERSGALNVENFLRQKLTMSSASSTQDQSTFIAGVYGSSINLRGLGTNQTLILVNGRRFGSGGNAQNVGLAQTINTIPLGSVERVEMLPTSAGAIYGSNAVGGVINIILKRNYTGGEVRLSYQNTFQSDAPTRQVDLSYGFSLEKGDRTQVMLTAGYSDRSELYYQDRPFMKEYDLRGSANTLSVDGTPVLSGLVQIFGTTNLVFKPAFGGTSLGASRTYVPVGITPTTAPLALAAALIANAGKIPDPVLYPALRSRQQQGGALQTFGHAPTLNSFGATLRRQMTSKLEFNAEFSVARQETFRYGTLLGYRPLEVSSPFNPFTTDAQVLMPLEGDRPNPTKNFTRRATAGLMYDLPHDWKLQADYTWTYGSNNFTTVSSGATFGAAYGVTYNPLVDTIAYPLDLTQYGYYTQTFSGGGGTNDVAIRGSGPLWSLPAGDPLLTFGLEHRNEGYDNGANALTVTDAAGNVLPGSTANISLAKNQTTKSVYLELQVPLISEKNARWWARELNLQLSGRREDFAVETGTATLALLPVPATPPVILANTAKYVSTNPTVGFSYKPVRDVMYRMSYGKGFLPPTYTQLMLNPTPSTALTQVVDRKRGNTRYGITTTGGGNPDLVPETSTSWNAGIVYQPLTGPLQGLRANLEYFLIRKQNNIGSLTAQQIVDAEDTYPERITRATPAAGDTFGVGAITRLSTAPFNLLRSLVEGFDFNLGYRRATSQFGTFDFSALATYNVLSTKKTSVTTPNLDYVSYTSVGVPQYLANATLVWDYRNWSVSWTTRYVPSLRVPAPPVTSAVTSAVLGQGGEWVPSQSYSDATFTYRFERRAQGTSASRLKRYTRGLEIGVGLINVFNKIPPYDVSSGAYRYSTWGDIRLREYRLSVKKEF